MASAAPRNALRLFVGNLPWSVGHGELKDFFRGFGRVVSANVKFDQKTGCSKGFGFVYFDDDGHVLQKLENNSLLLEGHILHVQIERDQ